MNKVIVEQEKLQHNIEVIKDKVKNAKIIAVLKGNAYGMDACIVGRKLLDNNIDFFAVSEISEAIELRANGFINPILLLQCNCVESEVLDIIKYNLTPSVGSNEDIKLLSKNSNKDIDVHLKIDTGFGRFGFLIDDESAKSLKETLDECSNVKITGTYSHFLESYAQDSKKTKEQFDKFLKAVECIKKQNINPGMLHICNSSAVFKYPEMYLDAVRVGSALTGRLQIKESTGLKKVGYFESTVCEIRKLKAGTTVGYSGTAYLKQDRLVAISEAGYADGIGVTGPKDSVRFIDKLRKIKAALKTLKEDGKTYVMINDKKYPILGRIGMKNFVVDITGSDVKVGDTIKVDVNLIFVDSKIKRQEI